VLAAVALLNRGWGLPKQTIETDPPSVILLHLDAARAMSAQLVAAFEQCTIEGSADISPTTPADLLAAPLPTE